MGQRFAETPRSHILPENFSVAPHVCCTCDQGLIFNCKESTAPDNVSAYVEPEASWHYRHARFRSTRFSTERASHSPLAISCESKPRGERLLAGRLYFFFREAVWLSSLCAHFLDTFQNFTDVHAAHRVIHWLFIAVS